MVDIYLQPSEQPLTDRMNTMPSYSPRPSRNITSLSAELLRTIFAFARGGVIDHDSDPFAEEWHDAGLDIDTIRNIRLTCRIFCNIGSEFLVRRLDVCLNSKSLDRVKEIVRNPSVARGIRAVRLNLDCYFRSFEDEGTFLTYVMRTLAQQRRVVRDYERYIDNLESGADRDPEQEAWFDSNGLTSVPPLPWKQLFEMSVASVRIQYACLVPLVDDPAEVFAKRDITTALLRGHAGYVRLIQEQENFFQDNHVVRVLASAMAEMPRARRLLITDDQRYMGEHSQPWPAMFEDIDLLMQQEFLRPRCWSYKRTGQFPTFLLHALPLAIFRMGHSLAHLDIRLSAPGEADWTLTKENILGLGQSAEALRTFRCLIDADVTIESSQFIPFLKAFTGGKVLNTYHVAFTRAPSPPKYVAIGPLLASLSSPDLAKVCINSCSFHLRDIKIFTAKLRGKIQSLKLRDIEILSGTVEEARELLRRSAIQLVLERPRAA